MKNRKALLSGILCLMSVLAFGQKKINLATEFNENQIKAVNRNISIYQADPMAIELNAAEGSGLALLKDVDFESGSIEIDLLGENNPGKCFIGIAFNIEDSETYEAVYFRPFNFVATEQIRKDHMVQYICHPEHTWYSLREKRTGEFEDELPEPPDPDDWFRARIKVTEENVKVFLYGEEKPVLKVERLNKTSSNKIGLWCGHGSSGRYRNLVIK